MTELFPAPIETERLRLERLAPDAVDVHALYRSFWTTEYADAVFECVPQTAHAHPKETADSLDRATERWADGEVAQWVVRPKAGEEEPRSGKHDDAGPIAGLASLRPHWDCRRADIGLLLDKPYWGRGYSGERAAALLAVAFDYLDLEVVTVDHAVDNGNSRRAVERYVERFGGRRDGVVRNYQPRGDVVDDVVHYSITREDWASNRPEDLEVDLDA